MSNKNNNYDVTSLTSLEKLCSALCAPAILENIRNPLIF